MPSRPQDLASPVRNGVYPYQGIRRNDFLVLSIDALNLAGTVLVAEVAQEAPQDVRSLLAVQLGSDDPLPGRWVLCWRLNYASSARFDLAHCHGHASTDTMIAVLAGVRAAIEPL